MCECQNKTCLQKTRVIKFKMCNLCFVRGQRSPESYSYSMARVFEYARGSTMWCGRVSVTLVDNMLWRMKHVDKENVM